MSEADARLFGPMKRGAWIWVGVFTLSGLALRLIFIHAKPLWYDEAFTAMMAGHATVEGLLRRLWTGDTHPPIYYLMQRAIVAHFGSSELTLRLPSVITGTLAIPLTALLGGPKTRSFARVATVALVAFLPALLHFSVEARSYGFVLLYSLLVFVLYREVLRRRSRVTIVFLFLLCAVMIYTHRATVVLLAAVQIHHHLLGRHSAAPGASKASFWDGATWVLVLGFAPWLLGAFNQIERWEWVGGVASYLQPDVFFRRYSPLMAVPDETVRKVGMLLTGALILAAMVTAHRRRAARPSAVSSPLLTEDPGLARWRRVAAALSSIGLLTGVILLLRAEPRSPELPLLADRYVGRMALFVSATQLFLLALPWLVRRLRRSSTRIARAITCFLSRLSLEVAVILFSLLVATVMTAMRDTVGYKQMIFIVPPLYLVCIDQLVSAYRLRGRVAVTAFVLLCLVSLPFQGRYNRRADYRAAAAVIAEVFRPGDAMVVYPKHQRKILSFYFRDLPLEAMAGLHSSGHTAVSSLRWPAGRRVWWVSEMTPRGRALLAQLPDFAEVLQTHTVDRLTILETRWRPATVSGGGVQAGP